MKNGLSGVLADLFGVLLVNRLTGIAPRFQQEAGAGLGKQGQRAQRGNKRPKKLHSSDYNPKYVVQDTNYFSRRLLVTTVTLERAMAADASIGESRPSAATGIPITL